MKEKNIFSKGYEENWSKDIFIIRNVIPSNPPRYQIKDLEGNEIELKLYREEHQKVFTEEFPSVLIKFKRKKRNNFS